MMVELKLQRHRAEGTGCRATSRIGRSMPTTPSFRHSRRRSWRSRLARWLNRDPLGGPGFELVRRRHPSLLTGGVNQTVFVWNNPTGTIDSDGLDVISIPIPRVGTGTGAGVGAGAGVGGAIGGAFCIGVAIGDALCNAFPDTMTKPGEWIGNLICPRSKPAPPPECTKVAETDTMCLYKCSSPVGPFMGGMPKPPGGCPRYVNVDGVKPMPGRDYPGFPPK
jgi:hypothetical protein